MLELHKMPQSEIQLFFARLIDVAQKTEDKATYLHNFVMTVMSWSNMFHSLNHASVLYSIYEDAQLRTQMDLALDGSRLKIAGLPVFHESQLFYPREFSAFIFSAPGYRLETPPGTSGISYSPKQLFLHRAALAAQVVQEPNWPSYSAADLRLRLWYQWHEVSKRLKTIYGIDQRIFDIEINAASVREE
jgi:hypothetical protein